MTSAMHSKINTYLLSIIGALMLIGVTIAGFICSKVWDINEKVAVQSQSVAAHTSQLAELKTDLKEVQASQQKIELALSDIKGAKSRQ